jgi:hypothetical protein
MFVCISCKKNTHKHIYVRYMLYSLGVEYIIIVGDPNLSASYTFDPVTRLMTIRCPDTFESLPEKIVRMCACVKEHFDPSYIVKIDDDVILYDTSHIRECEYGGLPYSTSCSRVHELHFNKCSDEKYNVPFSMDAWYKIIGTIPVDTVSYACGGYGYVLGKNAIGILSTTDELVYTTHMYEDIMVGYILHTHGVICESLLLDSMKHRDYGFSKDNVKVMLKNRDITHHITPKYLKYEFNEGVGAGLNDRKAVISTLLIEARATNRIAYIPHMKLSQIHNHDSLRSSCILNEYLIFDDPKYMYTLEPTPHDAVDISEDIPSEPTYVQRTFPNGLWFGKVWNTYEHEGFQLRNTSFKPIAEVKRIGDEVLRQLQGKTIGVHLRKGDRMSPTEVQRFTPAYVVRTLQNNDIHGTTYVATNEPHFTHSYFKTYRDFPELYEKRHDNYMLFAIEMYIVERCDVHIKTFQDSEHLYHSHADIYYLIPRSMHIHDNKVRDGAYEVKEHVLLKYIL